MILILGISISFVLLGLFEIAGEIANSFPDYRNARGYIVWHNVVIGVAITLFGIILPIILLLHGR